MHLKNMLTINCRFKINSPLIDYAFTIYCPTVMLAELMVGLAAVRAAMSDASPFDIE